MSERDELATDLHLIIKALRNTTDKRMMVCSSVDRAQIVDAILAAGYRKPQTITTAEELDALPDAVLILTEQGGYWESVKRMDGKNWWKEPGSQNVVHSCDLTIPATVLYTPEPAA